MNQNITISTMATRLNKYLSERGVASRRSVEQLIRDGRVFVDGRPILTPQTQVEPGQTVTVDGEPLPEHVEKVVYLLNKPAGYHCSNKRKTNERLVLDLLPEQERLFSIGRLDKDTEGLLLVTNDGDFANQVIHPSSGITREYLVKVSEEVSFDHLKCLSRGVSVQGCWVKPLKVVKQRRGTLRIALSEGKKHEVRLLIAAARLELLSLKRIRLGNLLLGNLPLGHYRLLTRQEQQALFA